MKKILYTLAAVATLFTACNKDEGTPDVGDNVPVQFSTAITKAAGTTWGSTDQIGVFMMNNGTPLTTARLADNVQYTNSTDGFSTASPIYYPQSGAVDFVAYYPYRATPGSYPYIYKVDVSDQTNPAAIDLLYSANATNKSRSTSAVGLTFEHKLSKVVLNVKAGTGIADLTGLGVVRIVGVPAWAEFNLATGDFSKLTHTLGFHSNKLAAATEGYEATYEAIVIPQEANTWSGRKLVFDLLPDRYEYAIPDGDDFLSGKTHTYNITIKKSGVTASRGEINDWQGTDSSTDLGEAKQIPIPQMVFIPKGTFLMGSSDGSNIVDGPGTGLNTTASEPNRSSNENQHKVTLTKDFYMGKYAVTFAQYDAFCEATIGNEKPGDNGWGRGNRPVINVSWNDAVAYCTWLSSVTGQTWRLPTEAQWEYACRGATNTAYSFGADATNINTYCWYTSNNTTNGEPYGTKEVGRKAPNDWGLYDMNGNVMEWCSDWYDYYSTDPANNPLGANSGSFRVVRGGSWSSSANNCRSAFRSRNTPVSGSFGIGFRVVLVP